MLSNTTQLYRARCGSKDREVGEVNRTLEHRLPRGTRGCNGSNNDAGG